MNESTKVVNVIEPKNAPKNAKVIDETMKKLGDVVRPKNIAMAYEMTDGGKTIRRHLRKQFTQPCNHEFNNEWTWKHDDPILKTIIEYFDPMFKTKTA